MVDPGEGKIRLQKIKMNKDRSKSTNDHAPGGPFAYICLFFFFFFLNGPTPASFLFIFGLFKQTILTTNECEKCHVHPVSGAGI